MWRIWQDSPEYGCDDNPSYDWYAQRSVDGHIVETHRCKTFEEADAYRSGKK